jgi:SAM-dependent methyltransferase
VASQARVPDDRRREPESREGDLGGSVEPEPWYLDRLCCPDCHADLARGALGAMACVGCGRRFAVDGAQLTLLPSEKARRTLVFPVLQAPTEAAPPDGPPDGAYRGPLTPRTNARHLSILATRAGRLDVLDWGCGGAEYRPLVEGLHHRYVGIDRAGSAADVIADAHGLPFKDASFDHVITNAVLEHTANPFLAIAEVARVMKPSAIFSGSVAFLEPHHFGSHFHVSADGISHLCRWAGLAVEGLWPQERWVVFDSLAAMPGPLSGPTRMALRLLSRLERALRRWYLHPREWRTGRWLTRKPPAEYQCELLEITGQVDFVARKPSR